MDRINSLIESAARLDRVGISVTRIGLVVVLVWIGGLKAFRYEDEGIVPFVANRSRGFRGRLDRTLSPGEGSTLFVAAEAAIQEA